MKKFLNKKSKLFFTLLVGFFSVLYTTENYGQATITINQGGAVKVNDGDMFYDAGGSSGNDGNTSYEITLEPNALGENVCLDFTMFNTYFSSGSLTGDSVCIFDGSSVSAHKIATLMGNYGSKWDQGGDVGVPATSGIAAVTSPGIFCSTNATGSLTIRFYNTNSTLSPGWVARVTTFKLLGSPGCNIKLSASQNPVCKGQSQPVTLTAIGAIVTATINNNFNSGSVGTGWQGTSSATFQDNSSTSCLKPSNDNSTYLWMASAACPRTLTSNTMDVSNGGTVSFEYRQAEANGNSSPCEGPDINMSGSTPETVYIQYSINGGGAWTTIKAILPSDVAGSGNDNYTGIGFETKVWNKVIVPIPTAARTATTQFRWIMPLCTSASTDNWGLDNVVIGSPKASTLTIKEKISGTVLGTSNSSPLTITLASIPTVTTTYVAIVSDGVSSCEDEIIISVSEQPSVDVQPSNKIICSGNGTSFSITASGATINGYQWEVNTGSGWSALTDNSIYAGATTNTLAISNATAGMTGYLYHCIVKETANACPATSNSASLTVNLAPAAYNVTGGGSYCSGATGLAVGLSGSQIGINYQLKLNGSDDGAVVAGDGNAISFGIKTASGTYTVVAINNSDATCTANMTGSATIQINAIPSVFNVSGSGSYCSNGTGVEVTLSGSESGMNYQLQESSVNSGSPISGTGSSLSFGLKTAGVYTVVASNASASSCTNNMSGSATITVNLVPTAFSVTGGGSYCSNGTGVVVSLSGSENGINYQLQKSGVDDGSPVLGTGSSLSFGLKTAGTYTVIASNASASSCSNPMTGNASVTMNASPSVFNVLGSGGYCSNGTGVEVTLSGSENGINYQLQKSSVDDGSPISGTGSALSFGLKTVGTYTVIATNASASSCTANMTGVATITLNALPTANVGAGGAITCSQNVNGVTIGASANPAYNYTWSPASGLSAIDISSPIANPTSKTTYTLFVEDKTSLCTASADVVVDVNKSIPTVTIPTSTTTISCGSSVNLTANVSPSTPGNWYPNDGSFSKIDNFTIKATPLVATTYTYSVGTGDCQASNSVLINVTRTLTSTFDFSKDTVCAGESTILSYTGNATAAANYFWGFDGGNAIPGAGLGPHTMKWFAPALHYVSLYVMENGCYSDTTLVPVFNKLCMVKVPNVFTPNGDGHNDKFFIVNLEYFPNTKCVVFNRWGNKVYEKSNYQNDWDAQDVAAGTYYYVIEFANGRLEAMTGTLTIVREGK